MTEELHEDLQMILITKTNPIPSQWTRVGQTLEKREETSSRTQKTRIYFSNTPNTSREYTREDLLSGPLPIRIDFFDQIPGLATHSWSLINGALEESGPNSRRGLPKKSEQQIEADIADLIRVAGRS